MPRRKFELHLSDSEHDALVEIAEARGLSFSALLRTHLVQHLIAPHRAAQREEPTP
jgi:hypothetical protein